jgi:hypothetical protein
LLNFPWRQILRSGHFLVLLAFFGVGLRAHSQRGVPSSVYPSTADSSAGAAQAKNLLGGTPPSAGSMHGIVTGESGEVYEGVSVTLTFADSTAPAARAVTTDSDGIFNFAGLPAGSFKLTFTSRGFSTRILTGVLHPGENYDAHSIVLPMASAASEVWVTASQMEIAQEQVHEEEQQRVLGLIPNFYVTYDPNAAPLNTRQKYSLAWKLSIDPITWLSVGAFAGVEQATNAFSGYGQGAQGYGKRFGAGYVDSLTNTMIGGAVLPSLFKQDPRYFYKGTGTVRSRAFYAIDRAVLCKGDNGRLQPNYSAILGSLAAAGISNLYYPASNRNGADLTFENTLIGTAESAVENLMQEFVIRRLTPRLPHMGAGNP